MRPTAGSGVLSPVGARGSGADEGADGAPRGIAMEADDRTFGRTPSRTSPTLRAPLRQSAKTRTGRSRTLGMNFRSPVEDPGIRLLRFAIGALLFIHGVYRAASGGVAGFGEFLSAQGLPWGGLVAWVLTLVEIVGTPLLALGFVVTPLALWFGVELLAGVLLVHWQAGWFVVGGGRNGVEYSLCLVAALLACVLSERRARRALSALSGA